MESVLAIIGGVMGVLAAVSMLLRILKLDNNKYVKVFLSLTNDLIGAYRGYSDSKSKK